MSETRAAGRENQRTRTRVAIVAAARTLLQSGSPMTMAVVAESALVSEATAYRYFPDLISLLSEAVAGLWPTPAEALKPVERSDDPVERVAFATEFLLRGVLAYEGSVRAMMSATIVRPETAGQRPGIRFGLIDQALIPLNDTLALTDPEAFAQLKRDLAVVVSSEALFALIDLSRLSANEAIASVVHTATTLTDAAVHNGGRERMRE